jgi:hypothetical protein
MFSLGLRGFSGADDPNPFVALRMGYQQDPFAARHSNRDEVLFRK